MPIADDIKASSATDGTARDGALPSEIGVEPPAWANEGRFPLPASWGDGPAILDGGGRPGIPVSLQSVPAARRRRRVVRREGDGANAALLPTAERQALNEGAVPLPLAAASAMDPTGETSEEKHEGSATHAAPGAPDEPTVHTVALEGPAAHGSLLAQDADDTGRQTESVQENAPAVPSRGGDRTQGYDTLAGARAELLATEPIHGSRPPLTDPTAKRMERLERLSRPIRRAQVDRGLPPLEVELRQQAANLRYREAQRKRRQAMDRILAEEQQRLVGRYNEYRREHGQTVLPGATRALARHDTSAVMSEPNADSEIETILDVLLSIPRQTPPPRRLLRPLHDAPRARRVHPAPSSGVLPDGTLCTAGYLSLSPTNTTRITYRPSTWRHQAPASSVREAER